MVEIIMVSVCGAFVAYGLFEKYPRSSGESAIAAAAIGLFVLAVILVVKP